MAHLQTSTLWDTVMSKPSLYLINGPLGAGKTTLLKFLLGTKKFEKKVGTLLAVRKMPEKGWKESEIEQFLLQLGSMDSNNFAVGVADTDDLQPNRIGTGQQRRIGASAVRRRLLQRQGRLEPGTWLWC